MLITYYFLYIIYAWDLRLDAVCFYIIFWWQSIFEKINSHILIHHILYLVAKDNWYLIFRHCWLLNIDGWRLMAERKSEVPKTAYNTIQYYQYKWEAIQYLLIFLLEAENLQSLVIISRVVLIPSFIMYTEKSLAW